MKFDWEKMKGNVIHCCTNANASELLEFLKLKGYKWCSGTLIYDNTRWYEYSKETCYFIENNLHVSYGKYEDLVGNYKILEFKDIIIKHPRICEILGIEFNKPYNIKGYEHNPIKVKYLNGKEEIVVINKWGLISSKKLVELIEHPELIEKIPEWTDEQKEAFKVLKEIFHIKYIIRNKSGMILGCRNQPTKYSDRWGVYGEFVNFSGVADNIFDFIKYESEIFKIPDVE